MAKTKRILLKAKEPLGLMENYKEDPKNFIEKGAILELVEEYDYSLDDPYQRYWLKDYFSPERIKKLTGYRIVERTLRVINSSKFKNSFTLRAFHDDLNGIWDKFEEVEPKDLEVLKILYDFDEYTESCKIWANRRYKGWDYEF